MRSTKVEPFRIDGRQSQRAWVRIWIATDPYGLGDASPIVHGDASLEIIASPFAPMLINV